MGKASSYRPFADALQEAALILGPMNREELRAAIEQPAAQLDARLETGLSERILDALGDSSGNLPLLEFTLAELWKRQHYGMLITAAYEEIGGVKKALATYAERVYASLTAEEQPRAQQIFTQLIRPGEDTEDTRRVATRRELGEKNWFLVSKLADARLVVTSRSANFNLPESRQDACAPRETVEIVHEALIRDWQRLRKWIDADREFRMWQEHLRVALRQWQTTDQDNDALLRGRVLEEAETWSNRRKEEVGQEEQQFIKTSRTFQDKQNKEQRQRAEEQIRIVKPTQERKKISQQRTRLIKRLWLLISIGLYLAVIAGYVLSRPEINLIPSINFLEVIEAKTLDLRFRLRGTRKPGNDIVIIALDRKSERALGRWQSSGRQWIAKMLDILHEDGAKVIGLDLVLAEPDEGSTPEAVDTLKTQYLKHAEPDDPGYEEMLSFFDEVQREHDYDRQLTEAIRNAGNVVLGYHLLNKNNTTSDYESETPLDPEREEAVHKFMNQITTYTMVRFPAGTARHPLQIPHVDEIQPNLPIFLEAARSFGYFTLYKDSDSYIRHAPLFREYQGKYYPSLALEVARLFLKQPLPYIIDVVGSEDRSSVDRIWLEDIKIPADEEGKLLINYYGAAGTFPYYSLSDVIYKNFDPGDFAGKIVLLGFTNPTYQDLHSVPVQPNTYPGVEIHATIIDNIFRADFLKQSGAALLIDTTVLIVLGATLGCIVLRVSPLRGIVAAAACLLVIAFVGYGAFWVLRIWLNMTFPIILVLIEYVTLTSYKYFTEDREKWKIKEAFRYYVSPSLVEQILETSDKLELGGEQKVLTALFSDVRGFTKMSEGMNPTELVEFLGEFFTDMTNVVLDHGGTLDKYIGDAIMAFYGAPVEQPDHAIRACRTAVNMLLRLGELQVRWKAYGLPAINIGIGINSGEMVVGNIGAQEHFNYTVMGDAVNLASRLEGTNKQYGTHIIISQFTYELIRDDSFIVRELDLVRVKGKDKPVTIYELIGYGDIFHHKQALATEFSKGLEAYRNKQWDQARQLFQALLHEYPDDYPSKIFIDRCSTYTVSPPPDDWDGVFEIKTK